MALGEINKIPNRPSIEGAQLGAELARFTEAAVAQVTGAGMEDERCKSCAFRLGTIPNQCLATVADALKCAIEQKPFGCHQTDRAGKLCAGYVALTMEAVVNGDELGRIPWGFSTDRIDEAEGQAD